MINEDLDELLTTLRKHGVTRYTMNGKDSSVNIVLGPPDSPPAPVHLDSSGKVLTQTDIEAENDRLLFAASEGG